MKRARLFAGRVALPVLVWSALLPVSPAWAEPSLQELFDGLFGAGTVNVASGETGAETFSPGPRSNEILVEFAGNAGSNTFGWYPASNPGQLNTVFGGAAGPGEVRVVAIGEQFGIFSSTPDGLWRSQRGYNADGFDHFKTFNHPGAPGGFIAAMEDLGGGGDQDFNDMVVSVRPFDTAGPAVTVALPPANGQNGWFVTSPVTGTVEADDRAAGGSPITGITCSGAAVGPITGLGTPLASAPISLTGDQVQDVTCSATDLAGNTGTSSPVVVKIDTTAPAVVGRQAGDSCSLPGASGWCRGTQTAGFTASDALSGVASPCAGTACDFVRSTTENGSTVVIASGPVVDMAGNQAAGVTAGPFKVDSFAPEIVIAVPAEGAVYLRHAVVVADYGCTDATSGVATCAGPVADGAAIDTASVGSRPFTVTAADAAGNTVDNTHTYRVVYHFGGFLRPIDNPPVVNTVKAGSAVPVKFTLGGDQGMTILAPGYPASRQTNCATGVPEDPIDQTDTAGGSMLAYDPATGQYHYSWKTDATWAGTCRDLIVRLDDGTDHLAHFKFR